MPPLHAERLHGRAAYRRAEAVVDPDGWLILRNGAPELPPPPARAAGPSPGTPRRPLHR